MDKNQIAAFVEYMVGFKSLGIDANGEEVQAPNSPELRAFMIASLGENSPTNGYYSIARKGAHAEKQRRALATFLVNMGFSIDPTLQVSA